MALAFQQPQPSPSIKSIGTVLRSIRVAKGLSQPQLEKRSGLSQSTISDVELGRRHQWENIALLAQGLDIPVEEVIRAAKQLEVTPDPLQQFVGSLIEAAEVIRPETMNSLFARANKP